MQQDIGTVEKSARTYSCALYIYILPRQLSNEFCKD